MVESSRITRANFVQLERSDNQEMRHALIALLDFFPIRQVPRCVDRAKQVLICPRTEQNLLLNALRVGQEHMAQQQDLRQSMLALAAARENFRMCWQQVRVQLVMNATLERVPTVVKRNVRHVTTVNIKSQWAVLRVFHVVRVCMGAIQLCAMSVPLVNLVAAMQATTLNVSLATKVDIKRKKGKRCVWTACPVNSVRMLERPIACSVQSTHLELLLV